MTYSPFMSIMKQWQTKYFAHWNILSASISMIFAMVLGSVTLPVQRTLPADDVSSLLINGQCHVMDVTQQEPT